MKLLGFGLSSLRGLNISTSYDGKGPMKIHEARDVNVFIGCNGAGKSTVLDAIHALKSAQKLAHLKRENTHNSHQVSLGLIFEDDTLFIQFHPIAKGEEIPDWINGQRIVVSHFRSNYLRASFERNARKFELSDDTAKDFEKFFDPWGRHIKYYEPVSDLKLNLSLCQEELWRLGTDLYGLIPSNLKLANRHVVDGSGMVTGDGTKYSNFSQPILLEFERDQIIAQLYFADDPWQPSRVPLSLFPSGWKGYMQIASWLKAQSSGSICLVEEPEAHLHPSLQKRLADRMLEVAGENDLQLFITTHSPIFMNMRPTNDVSVNVFQSIDHSQLEQMNAPHAILRELGILPSDIFLSNGIVWVEGESDRLYIKHWVEQYCRSYGISPIVEEKTHYAILPYGGSSLAHFGTGEELVDDLINLFSFSHNAFVVMDKDLDFGVGAERISSTKERISKGLNGMTWVTSGYTIESYLDSEFRNQYFAIEEERLKQITSHGKVDIARRYIKSNPVIDFSASQNQEIAIPIARLVETIRGWNRLSVRLQES